MSSETWPRHWSGAPRVLGALMLRRACRHVFSQEEVFLKGITEWLSFNFRHIPTAASFCVDDTREISIKVVSRERITEWYDHSC
jgi:hypothetical protein